MKIILWALMLALPLCSNARLRAVQILNTSNYSLNGLKKGGRPRNAVMLTLPVNTVGLVYIINTTTQEASSMIRSMPLANKLFEQYKGGGYTDMDSLSILLQPHDSSGIVATYMFADSASAWSYCLGKPAASIGAYSMPEFKGGSVSIKIAPITEPTNVWLGFGNVSGKDAVGISVEAVALLDDDDSTMFRKYDGMLAAPDVNTADFSNYLASNMKYPINARDHYITGRILVKFYIEKNGAVTEPTVIGSADFELDAEALRVVRNLPAFNPAIMVGRPSRIPVTLPLSFKLE